MNLHKSILIALLSSFTVLYGCGGGGSDSSAPVVEPPVDTNTPEAPYSFTKYRSILDQSNLQVSDPWGVEGNKSDVIKDGDFSGYYSDYFFVDQQSNNLVFEMSGYKMRSEIRVIENFDIAEAGKQRTLTAKIKPIDVETSMSGSDPNNDSVTYLQIHNKGEQEDGSGYIPHPLLRIVYEQERDGQTGHYWAVLKTNNLDCSNTSSHYGSTACNNAYERIDLGKADTDNFTYFELTVKESELTIMAINTTEATKEVRDISYWDNLLSYFKAGVYNQFENGTARVEFASLEYSVSDMDGYNWDLDQWKITIPASKDAWYGSGGSSAAELRPEHCGDSENKTLTNSSHLWHSAADVSYFHVANNRIYFGAHMAYGTTTSNTSYIRSELRELFNAQNLGNCSTSSDATSWSLYDTATGTDTHRLTSTLRIEDYPTIAGQDPKVVVGQVHGWEIKQALVKVVWEGETKPVRVILNKDFYKDNQSCSSCDWSYSVDMGTYAANQDWTYMIELNSEGILLKTEYIDGSNPASHLLKWGEPYSNTNNGTVTLTDKWTDSDVAFYFKAGIYPQFNTNANYINEYFEVSFGDITIEHY